MFASLSLSSLGDSRISGRFRRIEQLLKTQDAGTGADESPLAGIIKDVCPWLVGKALQFHKTNSRAIPRSFSALAPATRARDCSRVSRSPGKREGLPQFLPGSIRRRNAS